MKINAILFRNILTTWHQTIDRKMPWKGEKDPYLVWLSETILQQTRVEQGLSYYLKFKEKYPTIKDLARAPEDEVLKLWEGLGYYSRARNLHRAAKTVIEEFGGEFPDSYEKILNLKGVGPYTAAAISSFAFNKPFAVLDGNVFRVFSRIFSIETAIDSSEGKKVFSTLAQSFLDPEKPAKYNQAIMDFGATVCTPKQPGCTTCPFKEYCLGYQKGMINSLPRKEKNLTKKDRFFNYIFFLGEGSTLIQKRTASDIWKGLYEFPLIESQKISFDQELIIKSSLVSSITTENNIKTLNISKPFKQVLTHQRIFAVFWQIHLCQSFKNPNGIFIEIKKEELSTFAFPKIILDYLTGEWN